MTKLLSAKELLEVVRTAQADAQASGGGAKWPPRMALGGRSGPRRRAMERARERDAQDVAPPPGAAPFRIKRGGTVPVMEAVRAPQAPPPAPPPPRQAPVPFGLPSTSSPPEPLLAPIPATGLGADLPPASAILAAMRAKGAPLPTPREPEPLDAAPGPAPLAPLPPPPQSTAAELPVTVPGRRRARTQPDPRALLDAAPPASEPGPASPGRSLAALFPPPRGDGPPDSSPASPRPEAAPARPDAPPPRGPALTIPEPAARRSAPPIAREDPAEAPPSTVPIDLPDLDIEVKPAPIRAAVPKATAEARARSEDAPPVARRDRAEFQTQRVDRVRIEAERKAAEEAAARKAADEAAARAPEGLTATGPSAGAAQASALPAAPASEAAALTAAMPTRRERTGSKAFNAFAKLSAGGRVDERSEPAPPPVASAPSAPVPAPEPAAAAAQASARTAAPSIDISWLGNKPDWAPDSVPLDATTVDDGPAPVALSQDETVVLLNYDAQSSLEAISQRTGFSVYKVERIVERLMDQGVFEDLPASPVEEPHKKFHTPTRDAPPPPPSAMMALAAAAAEPAPESLEGPPTVVDPRARDAGPDIEVTESDEDLDDDEELPPASGTSDDVEKPDDPEVEANLRKLYETQLARLDADRRVALATEAGVSAPELFALAFDKDPDVAKALFENIHFTVEHARFAAFHHVTSFGIDRMALRNELVKDPQVQRRLLRNSHTSELVMRRILGPKRLLDIYRITNDRDVPDRQRMVARGTLRQKFQTADPEDRLQLLWNTEGRALTLLSGCPIDSKTTALFCARPVVSLMMVQNFAKFGATPPGILAHFLKQNLVRRQIGLRNQLLKHPNCPSDLKKQYM